MKKPLKGRLATNSLLVMFWQAVRLVMLAGWALLAARILGTEGYGLFAGLGGLASAIAGFVGLGTGLLMYQRVAINPKLFPQQWSQARAVNTISSIALSLLFAAIASQGNGSPPLFIAILAISEIILFPCITTAAFAFAAHDRMGWASALPAINAGFRLAAILALITSPMQQSLDRYLWLHLGASAASASIAVFAAHRVLRPSASSFRYSKSDAAEGMSFAAGWFTSTSLTTLDKSIVLRSAGESISGIYASSYRIASVFTMPIDAMVMSAMPRLFRLGQEAKSQTRLIGAMCSVAIVYGGALGGVLWLFSEPLASLLGPEYAMVAISLRWLAAWPLLYGLRQIACNVLMGRGYRKTRAALEGSTLIVMFCIANMTLPQYGIKGALSMLLASEAFIVLTSWCVLLATAKKPKPFKHE